jgi:hypothetical protein
MCYFEGNLARAVNRELGRHGKFWGREYDDVIVEGNEAFLDRYAYVLCNAVKAGLVERAADWAGVSSLETALGDAVLRVSALNRTRLHNATRRGQRVNRRDFFETLEMPLVVPPMWEGLTRDEAATCIEEMVSAGEKEYAARRSGKRALGMRAVMRQKPTDRPVEPSFRPKIRFFCKDPWRRKELLAEYRGFVGAYRETYGAYLNAARSGRRPAMEWPAWSYPPSCWTPQGVLGTA